MPIKKINFALAGLLILLSVSAKPVLASTLTVTDVTVPVNTPFSITLSGGNLPTPLAAGLAGQIILQTKELGPIGSWCVDAFHDVYLNGQYKYTTGILTTDSSGASLTNSHQLSGQQIHDVMALATYGNQQMATLTGINQQAMSGEIQAAIWSILYGAAVTVNGTDLSNLSVATFSNGIASLKALAASLPVGPAVALFSLNADGTIGAQDLIGSSTDLKHFANAPAPGVLGLLSIGGLAAVFLRRRRSDI